MKDQNKQFAYGIAAATAISFLVLWLSFRMEANAAATMSILGAAALSLVYVALQK